jgi:hypothetical protein
MSKFPDSGPLSMGTIRTALGLPAGQVKMSDFVGKTLYNTNNTTYTVPNLPLNIQYFYGRYYTNPYIAPIEVGYYTAGIISPPSGQIRNPTSLTLILSGGGGGGGGGESGSTAGLPNGDSGQKGGDGYTYTSATISYPVTIDFTVVGSGGTGGSGGSGGPYINGSKGGDGGTSKVLINGVEITVDGGKGGNEGDCDDCGGGGGGNGAIGGSGGGGGGATSRPGAAGGNGYNGYMIITWYYNI